MSILFVQTIQFMLNYVEHLLSFGESRILVYDQHPQKTLGTKSQVSFPTDNIFPCCQNSMLEEFYLLYDFTGGGLLKDCAGLLRTLYLNFLNHIYK